MAEIIATGPATIYEKNVNEVRSYVVDSAIIPIANHPQIPSKREVNAAAT
jgi:hypothetical protein